MNKFKIYQKRVRNNEVVDFLDGSPYCFNCNSDIYSNLTEKEVKENQITRCPVCLRSFLD